MSRLIVPARETRPVSLLEGRSVRECPLYSKVEGELLAFLVGVGVETGFLVGDELVC